MKPLGVTGQLSVPNEAWALTGERRPARKATKLWDPIHHDRHAAEIQKQRLGDLGHIVRVVRLLIQIEEVEP